MLNTYLKKIPLFNSLSNEQLDMLYKVGFIKNYSKGCAVLYQDDAADTFYIIASGSIKVTIMHEDDKEIVLSILKEGDFFGELSLLDDRPRSASVIAMRDTSLFLITRNRFNQLITSYPDILGKVLKEICKRLRFANEQIKNLVFLDAYERTICVLQQLAHSQGIKIGNNIEILHAPTHQELSSAVGVSRETITRIIKMLRKKRNLVSYKGKKIILKEGIWDPAVLKEIKM